MCLRLQKALSDSMENLMNMKKQKSISSLWERVVPLNYYLRFCILFLKLNKNFNALSGIQHIYRNENGPVTPVMQL